MRTYFSVRARRCCRVFLREHRIDRQRDVLETVSHGISE